MYSVECDMDGTDIYNNESPPGITTPKNLPKICQTNPASHFARFEETPNLKELVLQPASVEFIKQLDNGLEEGGLSGVFQVRIDREDRILKIFHGIQYKHGARGFIPEVRAYQNLVAGKSATAGIVPYCYGKSFITPSEWTFTGGTDWLRCFREDEEAAGALVLEYFPDATRLSLRHATPQVIKKALDGLALIHEDRVLHADTHPRNILVLPGDRVVWIDFDSAATCPWYQNFIGPYSFQREYKLVWCQLYCVILPWKWYALRRLKARGELQDYDALNLVERTLLDLGAKFHDDYPRCGDVAKSQL